MKRAIFISARLKSKRLKRKALKMINGKAVISHLIDRLKLSKKCKKIILLTSNISEDDDLVSLCNEEDIDIFRGDPVDVLKRIRDAANYFNIKTVVSCTGDNPLIDPYFIDEMINFHEKNKLDFTNSIGLPIGSYSYILEKSAITKACEIKDRRDTEVWGEYFTKTGLFKYDSYKIDNDEFCASKLRLTLDTIADYNFLTKLFSHFGNNNNLFSLKDIILVCKKYPELMKINSHVKQKKHLKIKIRKKYLNTVKVHH